MYEVYFKEVLVFEGHIEEVEIYCASNDWDTILDVAMMELERMMAVGYTWDSYYDHYDYYN